MRGSQRDIYGLGVSCDPAISSAVQISRGANNMKRTVDFLAEELKAEPVVDYLAEELKREDKQRSGLKVMAAKAGR